MDQPIPVGLKESRKELWNPYMHIWISDGILYCVFRDNLDMDIHVARHCVSDRIMFSDGVSYPCLINMKGLRSVTKEAREHMSVEGSMLVTAGAMIIGSALTRMLGNIFLTVNKPKAPARLFTDEEDALLWLKQYK